MACKQFFFSGTGSNSTLQVYLPVAISAVNTAAGSSTLTPAEHHWLVAGFFKNVRLTLSAAPGSGKSWTLDLMVNGVASGLQVVISDAATSGTSGATEATVSDGDLLAWRLTPSGFPTTTRFTIVSEFNGSASGEAGYGLANTALTTAVGRGSIWGGHVNTTSVIGQTGHVSAAGSVTKFAFRLETTPGVGASRTAVLYKNGVIQDGSGGTPDTRITITDATPGLTATTTFSLPVVVGDDVQIRTSVSGSPTNSNATFATKFIATTDTESNIGWWAAALISAAFMYPTGHTAAGGWGTESAMQLPAPISTVAVSDLRIVTSNTITNGAFTVRKNGANTALAVSMVGVTSGSDLANSVTLANGDIWAMAFTGTPGLNRTARWSMKLTAAADSPAGGGGGGVAPGRPFMGSLVGSVVMGW